MSLDESPKTAEAGIESVYDSDGQTARDAATIENQSRLRRLFSFTQLLAFALTFMSSWEVVVMNMGATFFNGGPRSLIWGQVLVIVGATAQALTLAELASILPIAGAQYHWTDMLAPEKHRRFITWMQGWVTWFAWVSTLGGSASSMGFVMQGLIAEGIPSYGQEGWHLTLIMIGLLVTTGLINAYAFRIVPWMETCTGVFHVILFVVFMAIFGALGQRNSADFVFTSDSTSSGWNPFVGFNVGMLMPAWGFIGFDGVNHMSEETRRAKNAVPRAMIWTILINGAMAFAISLMLLFYMGDPTSGGVLDSGYPIIPILRNIAGSTAANALVSCLVIITYFIVVATVASVSRLTWAWARDGALPQWFAYVDPKHRVPVRSLILPIVLVSLLSFLNVGSTSTTAFSAFTSLSSLGLYTSYIIAIVTLMYARTHGILGEQGSNARVKYGEWRLPKVLALPINTYALVWTCYITVFLPFPTEVPVDASNMNYAFPIYVFVVVAAIGWWFAWGKKNWPGLNKSAIHYVEKES
ncbi:amino acid/polyamine transporter I [Elsinoe ampelina]|uniref:Amino acid/polyamine transporter I n=1 Tax=Elsinoe ampelina TaxID=302913 RepID=A0A6A6GME0_9PEZI|nr:amino acid/polyamine transporter I [Elsinoe ampelina]